MPTPPLDDIWDCFFPPLSKGLEGPRAEAERVGLSQSRSSGPAVEHGTEEADEGVDNWVWLCFLCVSDRVAEDIVCISADRRSCTESIGILTRCAMARSKNSDLMDDMDDGGSDTTA